LANVETGGQPIPRVGVPAVGWMLPVLAVVAVASLRRRQDAG
jgi:MYXO-CTERM domain-containing protein